MQKEPKIANQACAEVKWSEEWEELLASVRTELKAYSLGEREMEDLHLEVCVGMSIGVLCCHMSSLRTTYRQSTQYTSRACLSSNVSQCADEEGSQGCQGRRVAQRPAYRRPCAQRDQLRLDSQGVSHRDARIMASLESLYSTAVWSSMAASCCQKPCK